MADCECLGICPFYNDRMANMPSMAKLTKKRFCKGNNKDCARFIVNKALGPQKVPSDLYPADREKAINILKSAV